MKPSVDISELTSRPWYQESDPDTRLKVLDKWEEDVYQSKLDSGDWSLQEQLAHEISATQARQAAAGLEPGTPEEIAKTIQSNRERDDRYETAMDVFEELDALLEQKKAIELQKKTMFGDDEQFDRQLEVVDDKITATKVSIRRRQDVSWNDLDLAKQARDTLEGKQDAAYFKGRIVVNPDLYFDRDKFVAAVKSVNVGPKPKAEAIAAWSRKRENLAAGKLEVLEETETFNEWVTGYLAVNPEATKGEVVSDFFATELGSKERKKIAAAKGINAWKDTLGAVTLGAGEYLSGLGRMMESPFVPGRNAFSQGMSDVGDVIADSGFDQLAASDAEKKALDAQMDVLGGSSATDALIETGTALIPDAALTLGTGGLGTGAKLAISASAKAAATTAVKKKLGSEASKEALARALGKELLGKKATSKLSKLEYIDALNKSVATFAIPAASSGGASYYGAYEAHRDRYAAMGLTGEALEEAARGSASVSALRTGLITGAITTKFGLTGVEGVGRLAQIAADPKARAALATGIKGYALKVGKGSLSEGMEEALDEGINGGLDALLENPDMTFDEWAESTLFAGAAGAILGAGVEIPTGAFESFAARTKKAVAQSPEMQARAEKVEELLESGLETTAEVLAEANEQEAEAAGNRVLDAAEERVTSLVDELDEIEQEINQLGPDDDPTELTARRDEIMGELGAVEGEGAAPDLVATSNRAVAELVAEGMDEREARAKVTETVNDSPWDDANPVSVEALIEASRDREVVVEEETAEATTTNEGDTAVQPPEVKVDSAVQPPEVKVDSEVVETSTAEDAPSPTSEAEPTFRANEGRAVTVDGNEGDIKIDEDGTVLLDQGEGTTPIILGKDPEQTFADSEFDVQIDERFEDDIASLDPVITEIGGKKLAEPIKRPPRNADRVYVSRDGTITAESRLGESRVPGGSRVTEAEFVSSDFSGDSPTMVLRDKKSGKEFTIEGEEAIVVGLELRRLEGAETKIEAPRYEDVKDIPEVREEVAQGVEDFKNKEAEAAAQFDRENEIFDKAVSRHLPNKPNLLKVTDESTTTATPEELSAAVDELSTLREQVYNETKNPNVRARIDEVLDAALADIAAVESRSKQASSGSKAETSNPAGSSPEKSSSGNTQVTPPTSTNRTVRKAFERQSKLIGALQGMGVRVVSVKNKAAAEALLGRKLQRAPRGARGFTTRIDGKPAIILMEDRIAKNPVGVDKLIMHEAIHAAHFKLRSQDSSLDDAALKEMLGNKKLARKMEDLYPGFKKLAPESQLAEVIVKMGEGKLLIDDLPNDLVGLIRRIIEFLKGNGLIEASPELEALTNTVLAEINKATNESDQDTKPKREAASSSEPKTEVSEGGVSEQPSGTSYRVDPTTEGKKFLAGIEKTAKDHKLGKAVEVKDAAFYTNPDTQLFMSEDGLAGVAVTADFDLVSVFKHPDSKADMKALLQEAVEAGGAVRLDAFSVNGFLPNLYKSFGFVPVSRVPFNKEFAPDDWPFDLAGEPDVVLMVHDPDGVLGFTFEDYNDVEGEVPAYDNWDEAAAAQQNALRVLAEASEDSDNDLTVEQENALIDEITDSPFRSVDDFLGGTTFGELVAETTRQRSVLSPEQNRAYDVVMNLHGDVVSDRDTGDLTNKKVRAFKYAPHNEQNPKEVLGHEIALRAAEKMGLIKNVSPSLKTFTFTGNTLGVTTLLPVDVFPEINGQGDTDVDTDLFGVPLDASPTVDPVTARAEAEVQSAREEVLGSEQARQSMVIMENKKPLTWVKVFDSSGFAVDEEVEADLVPGDWLLKTPDGDIIWATHDGSQWDYGSVFSSRVDDFDEGSIKNKDAIERILEDMDAAREQLVDDQAERLWDHWEKSNTYANTDVWQAAETGTATTHEKYIQIESVDGFLGSYENAAKQNPTPLDASPTVQPPKPGEKPVYLQPDLPMSAVNVLHGDSKILPKGSSKTKLDDVASKIAEVVAKHWGRKITSNDLIDKDGNVLPEAADIVEKITQMGVDEFEAAFNASGKSAANWYSTAIEAAMAVAGVIHPELTSDTEAAKSVGFKDAKKPAEAADLVMRMALAITSQNLSVEQNTRYAEAQFNIFKKTGKFDSTKVYGEKAESISGNLALANALIDELGFTGARAFVEKGFEVKQLREAISEVVGYPVSIAGKNTDLVNGAAIFGPKIGQGFLQNVMGNFTPVTIDLWMRRTWGRWTGDSVGAGATPERLGRMLQSIRDYGFALNPKSVDGIDMGLVKGVQSVLRTTPSSGNRFRSVSGPVAERLETDFDFANDVLALAKQLNKIGQAHYRLSRAPMKPETLANLNSGELSYKDFIRGQRTMLSAAERAHNAYKKKVSNATKRNKARVKKGQKPLESDNLPTINKGTFVKQWLIDNGYTAVHPNPGDLKPEWSLASNVIVNALKPIDVPGPADRTIITKVVRDIYDRLVAKGYDTTPADVQAVLWYPEKDLWAKLSGKEESNLKSSYDEQFIKIAEQRGLGTRAREVAQAVADARAGAARASGATQDGRATQAVDPASESELEASRSRQPKSKLTYDPDGEWSQVTNALLERARAAFPNIPSRIDRSIPAPARTVGKQVLFNPDMLAEMTEGMTPEDAAAAIEKIFIHETVHLGAVEELGDGEVVAHANQMTLDERLDVARGYLHRSAYASDRDYQIALNDFAGNDPRLTPAERRVRNYRLGHEALRMTYERLRTGHTTEETLGFLAMNPGVYKRAKFYLRSALRRLREWWRVRRDPALHAMMDRVEKALWQMETGRSHVERGEAPFDPNEGKPVTSKVFNTVLNREVETQQYAPAVADSPAAPGIYKEEGGDTVVRGFVHGSSQRGIQNLGDPNFSKDAEGLGYGTYFGDPDRYSYGSRGGARYQTDIRLKNPYMGSKSHINTRKNDPEIFNKVLEGVRQDAGLTPEEFAEFKSFFLATINPITAPGEFAYRMSQVKFDGSPALDEKLAPIRDEWEASNRNKLDMLEKWTGHDGVIAEDTGVVVAWKPEQVEVNKEIPLDTSPWGRKQRVPVFNSKKESKPGKYTPGGWLTAAFRWDRRLFKELEKARGRANAAMKRAEFFHKDIRDLMIDHFSIGLAGKSKAEIAVLRKKYQALDAVGKLDTSAWPMDLVNRGLGNTDNRLTKADEEAIRKIRKDGLAKAQGAYVRRRQNASTFDKRAIKENNPALADRAAKLREEAKDLFDLDVKAYKKAALDTEKQARARVAREARIDMHDVLNNQLPPEIADSLRDMRQEIDKLSRELKRDGIISDDLRATIDQNEGLWLHRSYKIFDQKNYVDWVKDSNDSDAAKIRNDALNFIEGELIDQEFARLVAGGMPRAQARADAKAAITKEDVREKFNDYLSVADEGAKNVLQGSTVSKETNALLKRGVVPDEIRKLWGEYEDPAINAAKSLGAVTQFIATQRFFQDIRDLGISEGWLSDTKKSDSDGNILVELLPNNGMTGRFNNTPDLRYTPLAGLYGPPMLRDALDATLNPKDRPKWLKFFMGLTGYSMATKTVLSWQSAWRNFWGNIVPTVANGNLGWGAGSRMKTAVIEDWVSLVKKGPKAVRERILRLTELNVIGESVTERLINDLTDGFGSDKKAVTFLERTLEKTMLSKLVPGSFEKAARFYGSQDDFWKIVNFDNEVKRVAKFRPGATQDAIEREAADIVRSTMPTYSQAPELVQAIRMFPAIAPYITFPAEVYRTTAGILRYGLGHTAEGIKTGNKEMRNAGIARLSGLALATAGLYGLTSMARSIHGWTADDEEDLRQQLPYWEKNSSFVMLKKQPNGDIDYFNLSYMNPYDVWSRPMRAFIRGLRNPDSGVADTIWETLSELIDPVAKEQILFGSLMDIARGVDKSGASVYDETDDVLRKAKLSLDHVYESALEPGTVASIRRVAKGYKGETSRSGRSYDFANDFVSAALGIKKSASNAESNLSWGSRTFKYNQRQASSEFTTVFKSSGTQTDREIITSYVRANDKMKEAYLALRKKAVASIRLGVMTKEEVIREMKASKLGDDVIADIFANRYRRYTPTKESIRIAKEKGDGLRNPQDRISLYKQALELVPPVQQLSQDDDF